MFDALSSSVNWFVENWCDTLWIPIALVAVHKGQRWKAVAFVLVCIMVMRLQMEVVESFGTDHGISGMFKMPIYTRGLWVYGVFTALYLILSRLSPYTRGPVYLAASLSIFFMAFAVSSIVMLF